MPNKSTKFARYAGGTSKPLRGFSAPCFKRQKATMTQVIGWFLVLITVICFVSPFITWWKLRKIKKSLKDMDTNIGREMPHIKVFGSYRKGLSWARKNQNVLPDNLNSEAKIAIFFDRLAMIGLGILILVAVVSVISKP